MAMRFTFSVDDGHPLDMRMAELLARHDLQATFYVPIRNREGYAVMTPAQLVELSSRFEIGSHTYDHCYLREVDIWEAYFQIEEGKKMLEDITGKPVQGFCYPGGKYTRRDVDLVRACGFRYARTTMNLRLDAGNDPYRLPTTIQFYPHGRGVYMRNFLTGNWLGRQDALRVAIRHDDWMRRLYALFDHACDHGQLFHLWTHSMEVEKLGAWDALDGFFSYVAAAVPREGRVTNAAVVEHGFRGVPLGNARPVSA